MASPTGERNTILVSIKNDYRFAMVPDALLVDGVSDRAVRLWALLARAARANASPTRAVLAEKLGCSVESIDRAVKELEARRWLQRVQRGLNRANEYVLDPTPIHASDAPSIDWTPHAGVVTRDDTGVVTGAVSESSPVTTPSSIERGLERTTAPAKNRPVRQRTSWAEKEPDDNGEDGGVAPISGRTKSKPRRRIGGPDSASGLAKTFEVLARERFTRKQLAFAQFNQDGTTGAINAWLDDGVSPDTVRAMIKVFLTEPFPERAPLWKTFLAARHRLADQALQVSNAQRDPVERYKRKPTPSGSLDYRERFRNG
jgi:hypothetical protein